ncbi:cysteine hydrolase family protein [Solirubrobacter soli]|uniref:cysteine hydrolase family protein n=1 Tax=Solirubrobacter soli TaxID=363832 RepID=UPI0003FB287F|nr:cysteine hydrolase [Solirubrobacter soli]
MPFPTDRAALLLIDPQVDFLDPSSVVWDVIGEEVERVDVVGKLARLRAAALDAGLPVFYSPHEYSDDEYGTWNHLTALDQLMFSRRMFDGAGPGSAFHPELLPTQGVTVLSPHKGLSGFWSGDLGIQLRQRDIQTLVVAGMAANLCLESHVRDAAENGFDVHVVGDATAGPGRAATDAALTSFALIASSVLTTDEVVEQLAVATAR